MGTIRLDLSFGRKKAGTVAATKPSDRAIGPIHEQSKKASSPVKFLEQVVFR